MTIMQTLRYTTAPVDYDGFGTVDHGIVGETSGKEVRLVGISPEHLDWQEMRYGSGMHCSHSKDSWNELVRHGLAK